MQRLFILVFAICLSSISSNAALPVKSNSPVVPDFLKVENFVRMSPAQFEKASGQRLGFVQKMYFKKLKRQLLKTDYTKESTLLAYYDVQKNKFKLDAVWFVLGCLIGPFAVLFSYTTRNQSKNKHISALIGLGVFIIWFGWFFIF